MLERLLQLVPVEVLVLGIVALIVIGVLWVMLVQQDKGNDNARSN